MFYPVKTPWVFRKLYPSLVWEKPTEEKIIYLTFDDGPNPVVTPFVLEQLKQYNAKATFFCIGKNVSQHTDIYKKILDEGHKTGNHTYNHLNGLKTPDEAYLKNIFEAAKYIDSDLFRPPYGRITRFQAKLLQDVKSQWSMPNGEWSKKNETETHHSPLTTHHTLLTSHLSPFTIVMWSVLSGDFDSKISPQRCLQNVILHGKPGSIILLHDSDKAWDRMSYALPKVLAHFSREGYQFKNI